jgi:hypothetical protein
VQVSQSSVFGSTILDQSGASLTSTTLAGLANSTTYYWRVNASNADSTNWSGAWSFTTIIAAPAVPVLSSPANGASGSPVLTLSWVPAAGPGETYSIQVSTSTEFAATVFAGDGISGSYAAVQGLGGGTYYWRVSGANAGGIGAWSAAWSFTTTTTQLIVLSSTWNLKSINIHPLDSSFAALVGSPAEFILIKDIYGHSYIPQFQIVDLDTLHTGTGYQIYSELQDTIVVTGYKVNVAATPVMLRASWNIIAYLPDSQMDVAVAMAAVTDQVVLVKNNAGAIFMPSLEIDDIGNLHVGEGYLVYAISAISFTYPTNPTQKRLATTAGLLKLPPPRHYRLSLNTGNNATYVGRTVTMEGHAVPDSCEIGAFNEQGTLVGAGAVIRGRCAITVWGKDLLAKSTRAGCAINEAVSFRLWDGKSEFPLDLTTDNSASSRYAVNGIVTGSLAVPEGFFIKKYDLSKVFPNPFRNNVKIEFDIPAITDASKQSIEINVFDIKGTLVATIAKGAYSAGHYEMGWNGSVRNGMLGSEAYIIQMKAQNFEKRVKIIRMR